MSSRDHAAYSYAPSPSRNNFKVRVVSSDDLVDDDIAGDMLGIGRVRTAFYVQRGYLVPAVSLDPNGSVRREGVTRSSVESQLAFKEHANLVRKIARWLSWLPYAVINGI